MWTDHLEFEALVRSISDYAIFLLDRHGHVVTWNAGAERFKGYKAHEIIGQSFTLFYPPNDLREGKPQRLLTTAIRDGRVEDEGWRLRKDGTRFWADVVITALRDDRGELLGFCKVTRDLTERRESEERRSFLAAVFDNLPGGIAILDHDLTFQAVNPTYARVFERDPEEFTGKHFFDVFPGTQDQIEGILRGVLETGKSFTAYSFPFMQDDASRQTYWDITYAPVRSGTGAVSGILAICFEVTPRVRLEHQVAEQQALTERIVQNAPAGIAFLDGDLVYRRLNDAYATLRGMTADQLRNRSIYEVFPGATQQFEHIMRQVLATGVPYTTTNFPFKFLLNGQEKQTYWDFTYHPVEDQQGRTGILILEVEVSDRQERERLQAEQIAQLKELDRYKDEFLSVISHELRTPLNFITGFASTLADEVQGPMNPHQHDAVEKILNGADRMLMLVDDLLDFAKIQSGHLELTRKPTTYGPVVAEVLDLMKPLADQKEIRVAYDVPADLLGYLDSARVAQVLTNILNNAIKFTERGGRITVTARRRGQDLLTEVADTGCGIAPEHTGKIFQRFQQLDMSRTRKAGGTGLGLAISKALIDAHGGAIGVTSEVGAGSTFWFTVPLVPAECWNNKDNK